MLSLRSHWNWAETVLDLAERRAFNAVWSLRSIRGNISEKVIVETSVLCMVRCELLFVSILSYGDCVADNYLPFNLCSIGQN